MSGEITLAAGYTFAAGEKLSVAKLRAAVEGIVAQIAAGAITETELADGSIGLDKLAEDVLTSVVVPDNAVTTNKLAGGAVTTSKIATDAVDRTKIASNVAGDAMTQNGDGSLSPVPDNATVEISAGKLQVKAAGITTAKIAALAVTTAKLGLSAITTAKINALAVTEAKLGALAVTAAKLAASAFGQVDVEDATMTLACTASTDNTWKSFTFTPRTSAGTLVALVIAEVTWGGTAPVVTFKLFDGASEEQTFDVQGITTGQQMVAALFHVPGDTASHTYTVKVNPDQTCSMGADSRIVWMEWPSK